MTNEQNISPYVKISASILKITACFVGLILGGSLAYYLGGTPNNAAGIVLGLVMGAYLFYYLAEKAVAARGGALSRLTEIRYINDWLVAAGSEIEAWADDLPLGRRHTAIIITAGLSLFLELILIRWEASYFPVFSLYKNLALLGCFCGLGLGYALVREGRLLLPATPPMLCALVFVFVVLRYGSGIVGANFLHIVPVREETAIFFQLQNFSSLTQIFVSIPIYILLSITFILNVLVMLPIGQFCGYLMQGSKPLVSYGYNLLGSIAGVALTFFLSWLWAGPVIWFGIVVAVVAHYLLVAKRARGVAVWSAVICLIIMGWPVTPMIQTIFSPYQIIEKKAQSNGLMLIRASGSYYQKIYDLALANANRDTNPSLRKIVGYYDLPFKTAIHLDQVAIVGAGSGNDVAAALRNGAGQVDAVEIDPAIRDLGIDNHPEHPYDDPRTNSIINDARNFFRTTPKQYDAIVYGVLDSHIVVSHGGNMRVDSFVYTTQGLADAFAHLKPGGIMSVAFALPNALTGRKIFRILQGLPNASSPSVVLTGYDNANTTTYMVSKGGSVNLPQAFMREHSLTDITTQYADMPKEAIDLPTDDWPFFYMDAKMYPLTYVVSLALMIGLAYYLVRRFLPGRRLDPPLFSFFFLGGGFMLIETKAMTELSLLFGNTWEVIGITIIGVLIMAYLSNLLASIWRRPSTLLAYIGIFIVIAAGYGMVISGGIGASDVIGKLAMVALLTSPMFFSGLIFSSLIKKTNNLCGAMAYNLMGAMMGGALEYNAMEFGFASLYLIALGLYALAWITTSFRNKALAA